MTSNPSSHAPIGAAPAATTSIGAYEKTAQGDHEALPHTSTVVDGQDEAIAMVGEQTRAVDPVVAARAVRKIDLFLIPSMILGCT